MLQKDLFLYYKTTVTREMALKYKLKLKDIKIEDFNHNTLFGKIDKTKLVVAAA